jgi:F0F1-type ATP synthase assembly protein I
LDDAQRRELSDIMFHRSSGSFELVISPLLLALLGFFIDDRAGTRPVFTVAFAVLGFAGAVVKIVCDYRLQMDRARRSRAGAGLP